MCALPLSVQDIGSCPTPTQRSFWSRFSSLEEKYRILWEETESAPLIPGEATSWLNRFANYRHSRRLIDFLAGEIRVFPADPVFQRVWRRRVEQEIREFGRKRFGWPDSYGDLLVSDNFFATSRRFVRQARRFDPEISGSDVGQALRNVWIVNSLQMLLGLEVALTPAVFAYSMLYPLTDNYLDDPMVSDEQKAALNDNLTLWLEGQTAPPVNAHHEQVRGLVSVIENQFDRQEFDSVFSSLLAIHWAQAGSMRQHDSGQSLDDDELLRISIRKGGASVVADGYLAAGRLDLAEEDFCMGYGAFLQLLDDLQDVQEDLQAGHQTLFTAAAGQGPLDDCVSRLHRFMQSVVEDARRIQGGQNGPTKNLILRNCIFLLVGAIAENRSLFTRRFRHRIESHWPLGMKSMLGLRRRGMRLFGGAAESLKQDRECKSIFDLV